MATKEERKALDDLTWEYAQLATKYEFLKNAASDLLSWLDAPSEFGPWIVKSGEDGMDDAVNYLKSQVME